MSDPNHPDFQAAIKQAVAAVDNHQRSPHRITSEELPVAKPQYLDMVDGDAKDPGPRALNDA